MQQDQHRLQGRMPFALHCSWTKLPSLAQWPRRWTFRLGPQKRLSRHHWDSCFVLQRKQPFVERRPLRRGLLWHRKEIRDGVRGEFIKTTSSCQQLLHTNGEPSGVGGSWNDDAATHRIRERSSRLGKGQQRGKQIGSSWGSNSKKRCLGKLWDWLDIPCSLQLLLRWASRDDDRVEMMSCRRRFWPPRHLLLTWSTKLIVEWVISLLSTSPFWTFFSSPQHNMDISGWRRAHSLACDSNISTWKAINQTLVLPSMGMASAIANSAACIRNSIRFTRGMLSLSEAMPRRIDCEKFSCVFAGVTVQFSTDSPLFSSPFRWTRFDT